MQGVLAQEDAKIGRNWRAQDRIRRDRCRPTRPGAHACLQPQLRTELSPTFGWEGGSLVEDECFLSPRYRCPCNWNERYEWRLKQWLGGMGVKAGHILKCNAAKGYTSWLAAIGVIRINLQAMATTA